MKKAIDRVKMRLRKVGECYGTDKVGKAGQGKAKRSEVRQK
jgi:hypothetical protein